MANDAGHPRGDVSTIASSEFRGETPPLDGPRSRDMYMEWNLHQTVVMDPSEIFDLRRSLSALRNTTAPPAPPPSPDTSHAPDSEAGHGGQPTDFTDAAPSLRRPDVVDIDRDGTQTFRPATSLRVTPKPLPDQTRLEMFDTRILWEGHDPFPATAMAASGLRRTPPILEAGRLLHHVNNAALSNHRLVLSGCSKPFDVWDLQRLWEDDLLREGHQILPFTVQTNISDAFVNVPSYLSKADGQATIVRKSLTMGPNTSDSFVFFECFTPVFADVYPDVTRGKSCTLLGLGVNSLTHDSRYRV